MSEVFSALAAASSRLIDNIYKLLVSLLGVSAVLGLLAFDGAGPLASFRSILLELDIPASWVGPVEHWLDQRLDWLVPVAVLVGLMAVWASNDGDVESRAPSTVWLCVFVLLENRPTLWVLVLTGIVAVMVSAVLVIRNEKLWTRDYWEELARRMSWSGVISVISLLWVFMWPVVWLLGRPREDSRG